MYAEFNLVLNRSNKIYLNFWSEDINCVYLKVMNLFIPLKIPEN